MLYKIFMLQTDVKYLNFYLTYSYIKFNLSQFKGSMQINVSVEPLMLI